MIFTALTDRPLKFKFFSLKLYNGTFFEVIDSFWEHVWVSSLQKTESHIETLIFI